MKFPKRTRVCGFTGARKSPTEFGKLNQHWKKAWFWEGESTYCQNRLFWTRNRSFLPFFLSNFDPFLGPLGLGRNPWINLDPRGISWSVVLNGLPSLGLALVKDQNNIGEEGVAPGGGGTCEGSVGVCAGLAGAIEAMANFPVNPQPFLIADMQVENGWYRPTCGQLALGGEPP